MLEFHHIGVLVDDVYVAAKSYAGLFGDAALDGPYEIKSQGVRVAFLPMDRGALEFVEQVDESSILDGLKKRRVKYYHVGYMTESFEGDLRDLAARNFKHLTTFESEAFAMRRCAFLFSPELQLVELIEKN